MVYIIEAIGRGYYKIGHGIVDNRLCALQTGCPDELKVAMTGEGGMILEKRLHTKFHHRLIRGEWFALTTEDLAEIKEILANSTVEQDGIDIEERTVKVQQIVINKKTVGKSFIKQLPGYPEKIEDTIIWGWVTAHSLYGDHADQRVKFLILEKDNHLYTRRVAAPNTETWDGMSGKTPHPSAVSQEVWSKIKESGQIFI